MSTATQPVDEFLTDCQECQTNFTRKMNELFQNPGALKSLEAYGELTQAGGLDTLSQDMKKVLTDDCKGEFVNIDKWDNSLKERVRQKLVEAINDPVKRPVRFSWELYHGDYDDVVIQTTATHFSMKFLSPWNKVSYDGQGNIIQHV
ncbi:MAG: hypothetical protein Kow0099_19500 [Candidatus Abyssubacteria bacterium]